MCRVRESSYLCTHISPQMYIPAVPSIQPAVYPLPPHPHLIHTGSSLHSASIVPPPPRPLPQYILEVPSIQPAVYPPCPLPDTYRQLPPFSQHPSDVLCTIHDASEAAVLSHRVIHLSSFDL